MPHGRFCYCEDCRDVRADMLNPLLHPIFAGDYNPPSMVDLIVESCKAAAKRAEQGRTPAAKYI